MAMRYAELLGGEREKPAFSVGCGGTAGGQYRILRVSKRQRGRRSLAVNDGAGGLFAMREQDLSQAGDGTGGSVDE